MRFDVGFEIRIEHTMNFPPLNVTQANQPLASPASGASWVVEVTPSTLQDAFLSVLKDVLSLVHRTLPRTELWLLMGTRVWQPNTRVVRYYKLWGALRAQGFKVPIDAKSSKETMIESDDGLKFFGAFKLSDLALEDIAAILLRNDCAYVVALPQELSFHEFLDLGWIGDLHADLEVVNCVLEKDALLLKRTGEFDDSERGLVVIGCPGTLQALFD